MAFTKEGLRAMEEAAQPLYLQHMPREVAMELDRRYGLVRTGHVSVHKNDGEWVSYDHRCVDKRKDLGRGRETEG